MTKPRIRIGNTVRKIGEREVGRVRDVSEGYATVVFKPGKENGEVRIALMPVTVLEQASLQDSSDRPI